MTKPFAPPRRLDTGDPLGGNAAPHVSPDGLTIYFVTSRAGGSGGNDIWTATRSDASAPFESAVPVTALNTDVGEHSPSLTADGKTVYFASDRDGGKGDYDLYVASRPSAAAAFGTPSPLGVNTEKRDIFPILVANGSAIYFISTVTGAFGVFRADLPAGAATRLGTPPNFSLPAQTASVAVSDDELTMVFSTDQTDPNRVGGTDMWIAGRRSTRDAWTGARPLREVNSPKEDYAHYLTADGCTLYFSSDRDSDAGRPDIYFATRPR